MLCLLLADALLSVSSFSGALPVSGFVLFFFSVSLLLSPSSSWSLSCLLSLAPSFLAHSYLFLRRLVALLVSVLFLPSSLFSPSLSVSVPLSFLLSRSRSFSGSLLPLFPCFSRSVLFLSDSVRFGLARFSLFISVSFPSVILSSVLVLEVRWRRLGITSVSGDGALSPVLLPPVVTSVGAGEGVDGPLPSHKSEK